MKTMKKRIIYRQGDMLIERVAKTKGEPQKPVDGRIILAYGEATGHHHSIEADAADWWKDGEDQFVEVRRATQVTHQEHAPIALSPGKYQVRRQREYHPQEIRRVAD